MYFEFKDEILPAKPLKARSLMGRAWNPPRGLSGQSPSFPAHLRIKTAKLLKPITVTTKGK
jgi:hypothetical protein